MKIFVKNGQVVLSLDAAVVGDFTIRTGVGGGHCNTDKHKNSLSGSHYAKKKLSVFSKSNQVTRSFGLLIAVLFLSVGHTASAQGLLNRALALMGNADAQYNLGNAYIYGVGVQHDPTKAVKWWRLAAGQDNPSAAFHLGVAYNYGEGVEKDYAEAVKWYRLAAESGNAAAQEAIESLQPLIGNVMSYRLAADQGDAYAQNALGLAYYRGDGVVQDYAEAVSWFRLAAESGNTAAQFNLGVALYWGRGVEQDSVEADKWWQMAAEQGDLDVKQLAR